MTDFKDNIRDDEIRIIGDSGAMAPNGPQNDSRWLRWVIAIVILIGVVIALLLLLSPGNEKPEADEENISYFEQQPSTATVPEPRAVPIPSPRPTPRQSTPPSTTSRCASTFPTGPSPRCR